MFFGVVDDVLGQFVPEFDKFARKVIDEFMNDVTECAVAAAKRRAEREAEAKCSKP
jgi:hypothetical protein